MKDLTKKKNRLDNYGISLYETTKERFSGRFSAYAGIEVQKNVFSSYASRFLSLWGRQGNIDNHINIKHQILVF